MDFYLMSDIVAVLICVGITLPFSLIIVEANKKNISRAETPQAVMKISLSLIVLFITLGLSFCVDVLNESLNWKIKAGLYRNLGIIVAIAIAGWIIFRNIRLILSRFHRSAGADDFIKYATNPAPPMPTKGKK